MTNDFISPNEPLAIGSSTLINTMIPASGAPVAPVIAALPIGGVTGAYLTHHHDHAGS